MNDVAWIQVITGLGGILLGAFMGAWLAGNRWLREARHSAYAQLLTALDQIAAQSGDVAVGRFHADPKQAFQDIANSSWQAANRVKLVGPTQVVGLAHGALEHSLRSWGEKPDEEWDRRREEFIRSAARAVQHPSIARLRRHRP